VALPHLAHEWGPDLDEALQEWAGLCRAIADPDPATGEARGETLEVCVPDASNERLARQLLGDLPARFHQLAYGDIWLRDTAPLLMAAPEEPGCLAVRFRFNGWGGKYDMPGDADLAERLTGALGCRSEAVDLVCEGGALEVDGEGTCLTTRQCLLSPARNPGLGEAEVTERLMGALGVTRVLWLDGMLDNDHTDGHIDTLARFVAPGRVVCAEPAPDDPNHATLTSLAQQLRDARDARDRPLEVLPIPSPGRVMDRQGQVMPASYCNFYIANTTVVVPTYGVPQDGDAVRAIGAFFPGRRAVGAPSRAILTGGGAFHCITQQWPACAPPADAP
jgi:agmatine deiminase